MQQPILVLTDPDYTLSLRERRPLDGNEVSLRLMIADRDFFLTPDGVAKLRAALAPYDPTHYRAAVCPPFLLDPHTEEAA
jgi:hypothetical protein